MSANFVDQDAVNKKLNITIKHLKNELYLTKMEHEEATQNFYDLFSSLETLVKERTAQLSEAEKTLKERNVELENAMVTINKYNTKLEGMLDSRTKELIKSERFAAFSLLSQGIVHNLKNPLTIISAGAQMIHFRKPDDSNVSEDIKQYINVVTKNISAVSKACKSMTDMIDSLMAKSRADNSEKAEIIDINKLLKQEIEFLNADLRFKTKTIKEINLSSEVLFAKIIPGELSQIVQNLINNALDAMHNQDNALITISTGKNDDEIWISVRDNGPGIPEEDQLKIFDPFFTTKPKATDNTQEPTGTGLGLHICTRMIKDYNGRIELKSVIGKGTEFITFIPKAEMKKPALILE